MSEPHAPALYPPPWRWARRWVWLPVGFTLIALAIYLIWSIRARQLLSAELTAAKGATLTFEDQPPTTPPDAPNAAAAFLEAARQLRLSPYQEQMLISTNLVGETNPLFAPLVKKNADAIAGSAPAATIPRANWNIKLTDSATWNAAADRCMMLQRLLLVASRADRSAGAEPESLRHLSECLALGKAFRSRPTLAALSLAATNDFAVLQTFREILPTLHVQDPPVHEQLVALMQQLQEAGETPWPQQTRQALNLRRAMAWQSLHDRLTAAQPVWSTLPPMQDAAQAWILQTYRRAINATTLDNWQQMKILPPVTMPAASLADWCARSFTRLDPPPIGDVSANRLHFSVLARQRMAAVAIALRFYATDHANQSPRELSALVPHYLPIIPIDPQSANHDPIRYRPDTDFPILYCLGDNGTDDHGDFVSDRGEWFTRDAVPRMKDDIFLLSATWPPPPKSAD